MKNGVIKSCRRERKQMGEYFIMSMRFNKSSPKEFGLIPGDELGVFFKVDDNSQWKSRPLYD